MLVDASNAFNSLNREVFLHNLSHICPGIFAFVKNCYNSSSRPFIIGGKELKSNGGNAQGDPVCMASYGIGVTLLINMLIDVVVTSTESQVVVLAYADDFSAAGKPYASQRTTKIFCRTKTKITNEGHRYLGETVGTKGFKDCYMEEKVIE